MSSIQELLSRFASIATSPKAQLERCLGEGKKVIGCFPYYAPEELVYATGMIPFGIWGAWGKVKAAREYFAPFYCTIAQMGLELLLNGKLKGLSGVIMSSMCDTLRSLTQNFQAADPDMPFFFLSHPQSRRPEYGVSFTVSQYTELLSGLESISGVRATDEKLREAIRLCNANRAARREFVRLCGEHPDVISCRSRCLALKSSYFMAKPEHTAMLNELNAKLRRLPASDGRSRRIVISGIINDSLALLDIFDGNEFVIVADDVAHESRGIRVDVAGEGDPIRALALQFAAQNADPLLYDPEMHSRTDHIIKLVRESRASGAVVLMMQFCDPEEFEYPTLKRALDDACIPSVVIGVDQQMDNFGQAKTILQAFADLL